MFSITSMFYRSSGVTKFQALIGVVMLLCVGIVNSAVAQYNNGYNYDNSYSFDSDYGYDNGYSYNNDYSVSSSSSSTEDSDELSPFWYYVITIALFILFGAPGVAVANAATKGKLDQKTNGLASGIVNNPVTRTNMGIVGDYLEQQNNNSNNQRR